MNCPTFTLVWEKTEAGVQVSGKQDFWSHLKLAEAQAKAFAWELQNLGGKWKFGIHFPDGSIKPIVLSDEASEEVWR